MTKRNLFLKRKYKSLFLTASFGLFFIMLLNMSYSVVAGNFLGENAIVAVNIVTPILSIASFCGGLFGIGAGLLYTNYAGKFDRDKMRNTFSLGLESTLFLSIALFIASLFLEDVYFSLYDLSAEVREYATQFYFFMRFALLLCPLHKYFAEMVYSDGDEKTFVLYTAVYVIGSIAFSALFASFWGMYGLGLGVLIGGIAGLLVLLLHFLRKDNNIRFSFYFSGAKLLKIMRYSIVDAGVFLYSSIRSILINQIILTYFNESILAAYGVVIAFIELELVFDGVGSTLCPLVNIYQGEGNQNGVRNVLKISNLYSLVLGLIFSIVLFIAAPLIVQLYGIDDETVKEASVIGLRIVSLGAVFTSFFDEYTSYYLISHHMLLSNIMVVLNMLVIKVSLVWLLSLLFGSNGIWIALALSPIVVLVLTGIIVRACYGKGQFPFIISKEQDNAHTANYSFIADEKELQPFWTEIKAFLERNDISNTVIQRILLICEELPMLVKERNVGKVVGMECFIKIEEKITMIFRDDGVHFDVTEDDLNVTSLRSYIVSRILEKAQDKKNLVTLSCNRCEFSFEKE